MATRRRKVQTAVETVSEHPIEEPKTTAENEKLAETAVGHLEDPNTTEDVVV